MTGTAGRRPYLARLEGQLDPELSRWLWLVKWLLTSRTRSCSCSSGSLISRLVLFAGLALLFTTPYPRRIFGFVLGLDRWVLRVVAYAALMRDEYPPFRLDQGGREPAGIE